MSFFVATLDAFFLVLSTILFCISGVAGVPTNVSLDLTSSSVLFTPQWRVASFQDGSQFAFADAFQAEVQVLLPEQATAVFYQGFKVAGGGLYLACIDCVKIDLNNGVIGGDAVVIDAHDDTENGTQPPETLFSFTNLDPNVQHLLSVVNLQDQRFNNASQITFNSVIAAVDPEDPGTSSSAGGGPSDILNLPTLTVTAPQTSATDGTSSTATSPTPPTSNAPPPPSPTTTGTHASQSIAGTPQPTSQAAGGGQSGTDSANPTDSSGRGEPTTTAGPSGSNPTGGGSQPSNSAPTAQPGSPQPSASPIFTGTPPGASGTSGASNGSAPATTGIAKSTIIVIAVAASVLVLALLGAVLIVLIRNQAARRRADPEGFAGLVNEAAAAAAVSQQPSFAPMRPQNPFVDTHPPDVPLDAAPEDVGESAEDIMAEPQPLSAPPPVPPRSPLRGNFSNTSPWLNRVPRNSSPARPS
ncbi:hypothetical protein OH77DRAFT_1508622 [Trametes cingulata]|nr:hypothetical protein OH77DRAFT_1508622 [Trametes cingulata]